MLLLACKKEEANTKNADCAACHPDDTSSIANQTFTYSYASLDTVLISDENEVSRICNWELFEAIEEGKIVEVNAGTKYEICKTHLPEIHVESFAIVNYCYDSIAEWDGKIKRLNESLWKIYSIKNQDTILYPPCESWKESFLQFYNQNFLDIGLPLIHLETQITIDSEIIAIEDVSSTLLYSTQAINYFESFLRQLFISDREISFEIKENLLILKSNGYELLAYSINELK